jgi:hypothetical protein
MSLKLDLKRLYSNSRHAEGTNQHLLKLLLVTILPAEKIFGNKCIMKLLSFDHRHTRIGARPLSDTIGSEVQLKLNTCVGRMTHERIVGFPKLRGHFEVPRLLYPFRLPVPSCELQSWSEQ